MPDPQSRQPSQDPCEPRRLAALRAYGILDTPPEREFDDIAQMAAQACGAPMAHVNFLDADRQWIKASYGHSTRQFPLDVGFCRHVLANPGMHVVGDLAADPATAHDTLVTGEPNARFYAGVPLMTGDGFVVGTLCVLDRKPRALDPQQVFILQALARNVMTLLDLRRSQDRYRSLFDTIDAGFCVVEVLDGPRPGTPDFRFVEANPAFVRLTGLRAAVGTLASEAVPDGNHLWRETFADVAATGVPARMEGPSLGRWYEVHAYRVGDPALRRVAVLFNDVTVRRRMVAELRARESELRTVADAMPGLVAFVDAGLTYRFANAAYRDWLGLAPEELVGRNVRDILPEAEFAARLPYFERALSGEEVRYERTWHLGGRAADIRYIPLRDESGAVTGIHLFVYDVSDRKRVEGALASRARDLEAQVEAQNRDRDRIWTLSPVLKVVARPDGVVRAVNPSWTRSLGWDEDSTLGRGFMDFVSPAEGAAPMARLREMLAGRSTGDVEATMATRGGGTRYVRWTMMREDGNLYGFGRDVTEQRHAEEALRQSQKLEAVGQLTGGVAHDFNNLLTIIRSSVDFLRRPDLAEERKRRYLDAVSDTVDRAAKLTGQLLAFARRQALRLEAFDVGETLRSVGEMLDTVTGARIRVVAEIPDEAFHVRTDRSQFETAIVNMAVNARDAMAGEGTLVLSVRRTPALPPIRGHAPAKAPFVAVSLSDTGAGISADLLGRIFEPFFTTKEVGKGTGLGLSQVFGFAKQSGGDVAVESAPGAGTTFTLYLPEALPADAPAERTPDTDEPLPRGQGQRILVVEDNLEVGRFATQILEDLGFVTSWATNAEEALVTLGEDGAGFDAVFSDVVMPGMGGIELAKLLRERMPWLPVVLASGYSHVLAQGGGHGFELLHKPYAADQLARILQRAMSARVPAHA